MEILKIKHVDNAIERRLNLQTVSMGLGVDVAPFLLANDEAGYIAAINALEKHVEIFGVGAPRDRVDVEGPRFVIKRTGTPRGNVGHQRRFHFEPVKDGAGVITHFKKYKLSEGLFNVDYEIRYVCDDTETDQQLTEILSSSFSSRKFLYGVNDDLSILPAGFYLIISGETVDLSRDYYIEKFQRYTAMEIPLEKSEYVGDVSELKEFEISAGSGEEFPAHSEDVTGM